VISASVIIATVDTGVNPSIPDLQGAIDANRAYLLLLHDPGDITAGPATYHRFWFRDAAYQLAALNRWGLHEEAADVLRSYPSRQRGDGFFYSQWREWDANGAAIWAIAEHDRLVGDDGLLHELAPAVRRGVNWIERARHGKVRRVGFTRAEREVKGLLPAGVSAEHLGPYDYYYWDDFWCLRGLLDGAYVARRVGELQAAQTIEAAAQAFREDILGSIQHAVRRLGEQVIPAGPFRGVDAGMIGSLAACVPLRLLPHDDPLVSGTLSVLRERFCVGPAFYQSIAHTGLGTYLTLQLAFVELEGHDLDGWERLRWLLDVATPTWTWPEAIHPQLGGGCMGDGHQGGAAADLLNMARSLRVREVDDGAVELLGILPPEWHGQPLEVRDAPTHHGRLSYEVRWDGDIPVLSWEWADGGTPLRAPGLDPEWSSAERSGEEKIAPATS
jgi:PAS domain-containing protein